MLNEKGGVPAPPNTETLISNRGFLSRSYLFCEVPISEKPKSNRSLVLSECQKSAQKFSQPLFDCLLARILARGSFGFDVTTEYELAWRMAALNGQVAEVRA